MPRLNPFALGRTKLTKRWEAAIDGHVIALVWSAPLGLLAAASVDGPIALFDVKTGQTRFNLPGHGFGTSCVAWSADGLHLASGGQDGKVRLWDPATGQQSFELQAGAAWVEGIAWCSIANVVASAAGKKLRLWNLDGAMICEMPDHPSTVADIQWKPSDAILASTAYGKVFLWDCLPTPLGNGENRPVREFTWQGSMLALAWSPNAEYIAAGAQDNSVHFWRMKTGEDLQMSGYPVKVRELSWDAQSRYLATGGGPAPCVWDCSGKGPAGTEPIQLDAHKANVTSLAFQHRGALLASGGEDGLVALWQPGKQEGAAALAKHADPISQLVWSSDDQFLAIGTASGGVLIYTTA
jgi:WD40 repeat protein